MQYVSLAQQGFYEPYQFLTQVLQARKARQDRLHERQQDVSYRDQAHRDALVQQSLENERLSKMDAINLPAQQLSLDEARRKSAMEKAADNFDITSLTAPEQMLPEQMPPGVQGPSRPAMQGPPALKPVDLSQPFYGLPQETQHAIVKQSGLPALNAAQLYGQQQAALTGVAPIPKAPPGMQPMKANIGGIEFGAAAPPTPPTIVHKDGRDWSIDPKTQQWEALPSVRKSDEKLLTDNEIKKFSALEQTTRDLDRIENAFKPFNVTGPGAAYLQALNPHQKDRALLNQAINGAVPNLARGVYGEVGVLTDKDVERYAKQFPTLNDTKAVRDAKLKALRDSVGQARTANLSLMNNAGRDIAGFKAQPPAGSAGELPKFHSEAEALAAGVKAPAPGQPAALVFDPKTGQFRPWVPE